MLELQKQTADSKTVQARIILIQIKNGNLLTAATKRQQK